MIKAFLFDYDGVYTPGTDDTGVSSRLSHNLAISLETASQWLSEIWKPFMTGKITENEVWQSLELHYGQSISIEQRNIWFTWDELKPHPDMVNMVRSLKASGYTVGVLSNAFANTKATIETQGGYTDFDFVITSCDVGYSKPQREIFEYALRQLSDIKADEVVFLDDRETNVTACEEVGMKGIYVTNHDKAIEDIKSIIGQS